MQKAEGTFVYNIHSSAIVSFDFLPKTVSRYISLEDNFCDDSCMCK